MKLRKEMTKLLIINKRHITDIDDNALCKRFGRSYERDERTGDVIAWYLEDEDWHEFTSMNSFFAAVCGLADGTKLVIQCTHPTHPGPYRITMQGSRSGDYDKANLKAGLPYTPDNYTWHHKEGVIFHSRNNIECDMYLIKTSYHGRIRHRGGVYEYERLTRDEYR